MNINNLPKEIQSLLAAAQAALVGTGCNHNIGLYPVKEWLNDPAALLRIGASRNVARCMLKEVLPNGQDKYDIAERLEELAYCNYPAAVMASVIKDVARGRGHTGVVDDDYLREHGRLVVQWIVDSWEFELRVYARLKRAGII